jgi:hypothetical protein
MRSPNSSDVPGDRSAPGVLLATGPVVTSGVGSLIFGSQATM